MNRTMSGQGRRIAIGAAGVAALATVVTVLPQLSRAEPAGAATGTDTIAPVAAIAQVPASRHLRPASHPTRTRPGHPRTRPAGTATASTPGTSPTGTSPTGTSPTGGTPASPSSTSPASTSPAATGGTSTGRTTAAAGGQQENWAGASSPLFRYVTHDGSTVTSGRADPAAGDGKVLALTIPAGAQASPGHAAEVESVQTRLYGSFSSRVRTADCSAQPRTGAVTGIFTYANDGADHNGDGITDNGELDVEILCARPWEVNLTIWTDYRESDNAQKRVSRVVDLRTGKVLSTCYLTGFDAPCQSVSAAENAPSALTAIPDFSSATGYHDYRIDWSAGRVVFTLTANGQDRTLWDYRGPSRRIPHTAASYLVNLWHTDDWSPTTGGPATGSPTAPLIATVDTTTITPAN